MPAGIYTGSKKAKYQNRKYKDRVKMLTGGQAKLAAKAPPPNKIDEKDFAVLRAEKAKGRGMGLQDESKKPGKIYKAALGVMAMKKASDKGAKGPELLSPVMLAKRLFKKKTGGVMKYKRGSGLDLPVISSVPPAVHKTKKTQKTAVMKEQFNKQKSRTLDYAKKKGLPTPFSLVGKGVQAMPLPGRLKLLKSLGKLPFVKGIGKKDVKKKMGGGIMKKYSSGGESSYTKGYEGRKTGKGVRESLKDKVTPMKKERLLEGLKASGKMGGGMMMQRPMGYSKGVSVKARGCKLGRNKPTKIT